MKNHCFSSINSFLKLRKVLAVRFEVAEYDADFYIILNHICQRGETPPDSGQRMKSRHAVSANNPPHHPHQHHPHPHPPSARPQADSDRLAAKAVSAGVKFPSSGDLKFPKKLGTELASLGFGGSLRLG